MKNLEQMFDSNMEQRFIEHLQSVHEKKGVAMMTVDATYALSILLAFQVAMEDDVFKDSYCHELVEKVYLGLRQTYFPDGIINDLLETHMRHKNAK